MKVVVSDTSPISALIRLDILEILPQMYGEVLIPPAVYAELLNLSAFGFEMDFLRNLLTFQLLSGLLSGNWLFFWQFVVHFGTNVQAQTLFAIRSQQLMWSILGPMYGHGPCSQFTRNN